MDLLKRKREFDNESTCFVCQSDKKDPETNYRPNKPVTEINLKASYIRLQCELWRKKIDRPEKMTTALSVLERLFNDNGNPKLVWHRKDCRPNFMSKAKLEHYADATETMDVESDNDMLDNFLRIVIFVSEAKLFLT